MISVIASWIDLAWITWILGICFTKAVENMTGSRSAKQDGVSCLFYGLMVVTVYAQVWSLFGKVAALAHMILLLFCMIAGAFLLIKFRKAVKTIQNAGEYAVLAVLIILFAYGSSRGYIHYDTSLYHAQSIRWVEEYGLVRGLGNLQSRFAYNSAAFPLSALFSFKWLTGTSLHTVPGFMALLLTLESVKPVFYKEVRKDFMANLIRVAALCYVLSIFTEMISPASDYFTVVTIFYVLIKWFSLEEMAEQKARPLAYAMLCFVLFWAITMKLSAGALLLLIMKPLYLLLGKKNRQKYWKRELSTYLLMGFIIVLPYLIRNYYLSGWLIYPLPSINLFQVPWKVPESMAVYDYQEISTFARGISVGQYGESLLTWLPGWFAGQTSFYKVFLLAAAVSIFMWAVMTCKMLYTDFQKNEGWCFSTGILIVALLFWFVTSPSIRFGVAFVLCVPMLVFGKLYQRRYRKNGLILVICGVLLVYKLFTCLQSCGYYAKNDYWMWQKPYDQFQTATYKVDGQDIYYPVNGDQAGYDAFPSSERPREDLGLLDGATIQGGFCCKLLK